MILYEFPFNERIRLLMRLEHLFKRLFQYSNASDALQQHIALGLMFEIMDVCDRAEVRSGILLDIDKQKITLESYRDHPNVDVSVLNQAINELSQVYQELSLSDRVGQKVKENPWLMSLKSRLCVPGGASQIDMPSYYAWQIAPVEKRMSDLTQWVMPFLTLYKGIAKVLQFLRESGQRKLHEAAQGTYQEMLGGQTYQMARLWLDVDDGHVFPEINANKYMIWLRFSELKDDCATTVYTPGLKFDLALCSL